MSIISQDELLKMARAIDPNVDRLSDDGEMEAFAAAIEARVVEQCAQECERLSEEKAYQTDSQGACDDCATAIRRLLDDAKETK